MITRKTVLMALGPALLVVALAVGGSPTSGGGVLARPPKPPTATPPPGGGFTSRIAFAKLVTTGSGKNKTSAMQVFVAWPDGSNPVQVTTSGSNRPRSWSQDGWMSVEDRGAGLVRILNVPPGNPGLATQVASFAWPPGARGARWSAQLDSLGAVRPASQQRLAFREGPAGSSAIVLRRHDGSDPITVTGHTTTCMPSQNPGCSGSRYDHYLFGWLPSDLAAGTIRLLYALREHVYVDGLETADLVSYRVTTLDSTSWPAVSVAGDAPLLFGGPAVTALSLGVSRDGTRAVYDKNLGSPNEPYLHVAPLEYNAATGATTLRSDLAVHRAETGGTNIVVFSAGEFSPDNSQLVLNGITDPETSVYESVYVTSAATSGPIVEVDGSGNVTADSPIWGP